ncbi:unnamed protein product [Fraxinus pennsylvanica]|uniref:BSD domain-containing protein n=1 Tax=Fraxinus pennsylvanica TaxID=56036 RepID=A0AAD1ZZ61_9LAMI|nr:unnamed protein product [Fraxinus pennsylvanica]
MNFFKSILSEDSVPPKRENPHDPESESPLQRNKDPDDVGQDPVHIDPSPKSPSDSSGDGGIGGGGWSFGGLIKTFTTQSESVLETYRRDLREFGSGLRKESEVIREVASRAVKELPASLEAGASVAHGSLESVGQALDGVLKSTTDIISQGKESLVSGSDVESETPETNKSLSSGRYSRFDAQLIAIQSDANSFCKDPEDIEEYKKWKSGFKLEERSSELEGLIGENEVLESLYKRLVPSTVDHETFWCRYFYRVHKLKQQESARANLVKRAISVDDDEELSWDVDDDDEDNGWEQKSNVKGEHKDESSNEGSVDRNLRCAEKQEGSGNVQNNEEGDYSIVDEVDKNDAVDSSKKSINNVSSDEKVKSEEINEVKNDEKLESDKVAEEKNDVKVESEKITEEKNDKKVKSNEKVDEEAKSEKNGSGKESEVSSHQSAAEEDLDWDEIDDIESHDGKKVSTTHEGSTNRDELRNRLSIAEEDEDLSWDIEDDDDEPVKA